MAAGSETRAERRAAEAIEFADSEWNVATIRQRFRSGGGFVRAGLCGDLRHLEHEAAPGRGHARVSRAAA